MRRFPHRAARAALAALALAGPARAQGAPDPITAACGAAGFEWLCVARDLFGRVTSALEDVQGQLGDLAGELAASWFLDAVAGTAAGTGELGRIVGGLEAAVREGPERFRAAVRDAVQQARRAANGVRVAAPGTPGWWRENAVKGNPAAALADAVSDARRDEATVRQGEAVAAQQLSQGLADAMIEADTARRAAEAVLQPSVGGVGGGTAARLEDAARTAVSTREGIQVMTEGLADLMRQDATLSAALSEQVKALVQQNALTNWQLQLAVSSLSRQIDLEVAERQARLQAELAGAFDEGEGVGSGLDRAVRAGVEAFEVEAGELTARGLGW